MPAKGQRRKQQIIDTAKEMFMKSGFQSTHIGQVCDKLDIARGTVYQYFGNKREILYAILESVEEQFDDIFDVDDLQEFLAADPDHDALKEFVVNRLVACIKAIMDEPIVIKLMYKEIVGIDDEVVANVTSFVDYVVKTVKREFEILREKGFYQKEVDARVAATMLIGGVLLIVHEYDRDGKNILDEKDVFSSIADMYLNGVL